MSEQSKTSPPSQEQPYPQAAAVPYSHQTYNGGPFPPPGPPGYMPPFFAYPPPPDGAHAEGQNGVAPAPYMMALPPGVVYAYPPHPQGPGFGPPPTSTAPPALRPKRKQVKMACTNCASACKRCDETRPCERCVKYGTAETCVDGQRKERKKGVKRGPYKRKNKSEEANFSESPSEWPNGQAPPPPVQAPPNTTHPPGPYFPEGGYYGPTIYYGPPGFVQHPQDGSQPGPDGQPPHANGQPPMVPYFIHPGGYPPFSHYPPMYQGPPPPGAPQQQQPGQPGAQPGTQEQPTTINPADAARKPDDAPQAGNGLQPATNGKKRSRTTKNGEGKSKKAKANGVGGGGDKGKEDLGGVGQQHQPVRLVNGDAEVDSTG